MDIGIFGVGSIGCYLGAKLSLAGLNTTLICREKVKADILENHGIHITDYLGNSDSVIPNQLLTDISPQNFDILFVTLKCHQINDAIEDILTLLSPKTHVIFMQNGLGSLDSIKDKLVKINFSLGITPFNVLKQKGSRYHKGTEGKFLFEEIPLTQQIKSALSQIGDDCELHQNMEPVIYGKLLLNLNNALNAIADLPIKQELEDSRLRHVLADAMSEWLEIAQNLNISLFQFTAVRPVLLPKILKLPNWLFKLVAKKMLDIDPLARSSMWEDIHAKQKTEIAYLNGAVVSYGQKYGKPTPVNWAICDAIRRLERGNDVKLDEFLTQLKTLRAKG